MTELIELAVLNMIKDLWGGYSQIQTEMYLEF